MHHPLYLRLRLLALKLTMKKRQQLCMSHSSEQVTVMQYLADTDTHLHTLHRYDAVKKMSLRYNAALPTSVKVLLDS